MKKEWYVVNTVTGYEYSVKDKLEMMIKNQALNDGFDSVESWQKNNVLKANADPFHIKKISVGHMRQNGGKQFKFR